MDTQEALRVEGLSCSPILHDISFSVKKGKVFGIIGPNGAGKTTLFKSLLGIHNFGKMTYQTISFHAPIGYMPENVVFPDHLTVHEVFSIMGSAVKGSRQLLEICRDMVPIHVSENRAVNSCSKGEKRKIALHLSLLSGPEVLLLDEPSDGLDVMSRLQLRDFIHKISRMGIAVLLSSHVLTELESMTHEGVILRKGKIAATYPLVESEEGTKYIITCTQDVTRLVPQLKEMGSSDVVLSKSDQIVVQKREFLGSVVDSLVKQDALLRVERAESSLEDLFVRLCHD